MPALLAFKSVLLSQVTAKRLLVSSSNRVTATHAMLSTRIRVRYGADGHSGPSVLASNRGCSPTCHGLERRPYPTPADLATLAVSHSCQTHSDWDSTWFLIICYYNLCCRVLGAEEKGTPDSSFRSASNRIAFR